MAENVLQRLTLPFVLPWFKNPSVVGIDIGISSIKVVQLRKEKEKAILETYGEIATAPYISQEAGKSVELKDEQIVEGLTDLLREAKVTTKRAIVAIPLRRSFLTTFEMPKMSAHELKQAVPFEARKYIPVAIDDVLLDWRVLAELDISEELHRTIESKRDKVVILLAAVFKEVAERYKNIVRSAGLDPEGFEIEAFSLARAALTRQAGPVLLIDFGSKSMNMMIVEFGVVRIAHSIDQGSQDITNALSKALGVSFDRAEELKRTYGLAEDPEYQEMVSVITPFIDSLLLEARRFVENYRKDTGAGVSKIILAGSGSLLKGFMNYIIKEFGVEAEMANPFIKVSYPVILQPLLRDIGSSFAVATGLALNIVSK